MNSSSQFQQEKYATAAEGRQRAVPGLFSALIVIALSALICWIWRTSPTERAASSEPQGAAARELAAVAEQDIPGALTTMIGTAGFLDQFKVRPSKCRQPLAWVSAVAAPGAQTSVIRLRSGSYISPAITLTSKPVRLAVPYPAAYELGHGVLTIIGSVNGVVIGLVPLWRPQPGRPVASAEVHWSPDNVCRHANG